MRLIVPLFLVFFSSCAAMTNLPRPVNSINEGNMRVVSDGTEIFVYTAEKNSRGPVIYVLAGITGINHYKESDIINLLCSDKNNAVVIHPRGTGYSDGRRGDTDDFNKIIRDYVEIISEDMQSRFKGRKIILYGHSMSAAIALAAARDLPGINGLILVNPPYIMKQAAGMTPSITDYIKYGVYMIFAPHTPVVNMAGDPELIKNEEEKIEALERNSDPLLTRYHSMYCMLGAKKLMDNMAEIAGSVKVPLLMLYGASDSIVDKKGCMEVYNAYAGKNKEFTEVKGGPHGKGTVILAGKKITAWTSGL
jgi:alpha-beta hydrolase superfamily lysophospholipase